MAPMIERQDQAERKATLQELYVSLTSRLGLAGSPVFYFPSPEHLLHAPEGNSMLSLLSQVAHYPKAIVILDGELKDQGLLGGLEVGLLIQGRSTPDRTGFVAANKHWFIRETNRIRSQFSQLNGDLNETHHMIAEFASICRKTAIDRYNAREHTPGRRLLPARSSQMWTLSDALIMTETAYLQPIPSRSSSTVPSNKKTIH